MFVRSAVFHAAIEIKVGTSYRVFICHQYIHTTICDVWTWHVADRAAFALLDRGPLSILALAMQTRDQRMVGDTQLKTFMKSHDKNFRALMQPSYLRGSLAGRTPTKKGSRRKRNFTLFLDSVRV